MHEVSSPSGNARCFQCTEQMQWLVSEEENREREGRRREERDGAEERYDEAQEDERSLLCSVKTLRFQLFFCPSPQPRDTM